MRERMTVLENENATLKRKVRDLEFELQRSRGSGSRSGAGSADQPAEVPRDPLASPASLLLELQRRYQRDLGDLPRQTEPQIENLKRRSEKWAAATNLELRGKSRWLVRFGEIYEISPGKHEAVATILDDATFAPIGEPLRLDIPGRYVDRIRSMDRARQRDEDRDPRSQRGTPGVTRTPPTAGWELHVSVASDMKFRPDTPDVGLFNAVTLVGSYVEFGMKLEWQGLTEVEIPAEAITPAGGATPPAPKPPQRPVGNPR